MEVKLKGVRLAFPDLFKATDFNGDGNFKFRATFLVPKGSENHKLLSAAIMEVAKEKWKDKAQRMVEKIKADNNLCLRDGDLKDYEGFEGNMAVSATNVTRPSLFDRDGRTQVTEADGIIYGGCYVNAIIDVYAYDKYGAQINASIKGVQKYADGDAFTGATVAKEGDFEDLTDGVDADDNEENSVGAGLL